MLAYISGKIIETLEHSQIIIKTPSGVGYLVTVNPNKNYMVNENVELYLYESVKETGTELYGFDQAKSLIWVKKLLKVSGVGIKMAALIIYHLGWQYLIEIIQGGDSQSLSEVKGLGKKTASKILLELKGSIDNYTEDSISHKQSLTNNLFTIDFVDTLSELGYRRGEIVELITHLKKQKLWDETNLVQTVKSGLEMMGKGRFN